MATRCLTFVLLLLFAAPAPATDLTITATTVIIVSGNAETGIANETITAGQTVYRDPATSKVRKADCTTSADTANLVGVATNNAAANQPVSFLTAGDINLGVAVVPGTTYVLSATAGGICPIGDMATTRRLSYVGYAVTTANVRLMIKPTGITMP